MWRTSFVMWVAPLALNTNVPNLVCAERLCLYHHGVDEVKWDISLHFTMRLVQDDVCYVLLITLYLLNVSLSFWTKYALFKL